MGKRRRGRELALKLLYRLDLTGEKWEDVRVRVDEYEKNEAVLDFAVVLVEAVLSRRERIDAALESASDRWRVNRMPFIDRNVIRIALAEHLVRGRPEPAIIIDEAVELVRTYSTDESGSFVNGVLDRILREREPGSLAADSGAEESAADSGAEETGAESTPEGS
ncbi:MAG: transcription antitermination factor NusB [Candidatus Eisenbacteria bacterium]|nr:transcription antitermination factor NusB [Candidatus Eisenbacteria bacterium]